jgi:hypothetical protein
MLSLAFYGCTWMGRLPAIVLHRIALRPNMCRGMTNNTPQENYAIFWRTFAEQYPFFALHKVDWNATDNEFRPQVSANTKPDELFQVFRKMIGAATGFAYRLGSSKYQRRV